MFPGSLWAQYDGGLFWHGEQNIVANNVLLGNKQISLRFKCSSCPLLQIHVCLVAQPNYANKGEEDSLLQIMTLKGVYCSRQTLLALRRQGLARVTSNINCWLSLWKEHLPRSHWQHGKIWFWCWCWCCPAELARILFLFWSPLHSSLVSSCALVHYQLSWSSFATQYTPVNCRHMPLRDKESKFWKWTIWLRRQR